MPRVLGIDHGTKTTGWGLIDANIVNGELDYKYLEHGFIRNEEKYSYPAYIKFIATKVRDLLAYKLPACVALEAPKDNRGFKTTQRLTELLGAIKYVVMLAGVPMSEIPPSTMKLLVTGYGWSTKEEVAAHSAKILDITFEEIVVPKYYKTGEKAGKVRSYVLDGSDALGLSLALLPYVKSQGGCFEYDPKRS